MPEDEFTIETLESGEQVRVFPSGKRTLIRSGSALKDQLEQDESALKEAVQALREAQTATIEAKLASMEDGTSVPPEKRSL